MKNILLFPFFVLLSFTIIHAQQVTNERAIFWLHGLGGDEGAWTRASNATSSGATGFPARKAYCISLDYAKQVYTLDIAANHIRSKILEQDYTLMTGAGVGSNPSKNFIIAHSQGGLVARTLDKQYVTNSTLSPRRIYGIVTFGTPHQGARILNNRSLFNNFVDAACTELIAGPAEELIETNFWLDLVTSGASVRQILAPLCGVLSTAAPLAFSDFTQPITDDYMIGASALNTLNSFPITSTATNKVAFYGVEDYNTAVWRVMYNIIEKKPNVFNYFEANDDSPLLNKINQNTIKYQNKVLFWQDRYNSMSQSYCSWWQWIINSPFCVINDALLNNNRASAITMRNQWQRGVDWWATAGNRYNTITGAREYVASGTQYECSCEEYDFYGTQISGWSNYVSNPTDCTSSGSQQCYLTGSAIVNYQVVQKESDGVVLRESAENYPGCTYKVPMIGSNHQQMRNDSNTKDRLTELYNGVHGIYFKTNAR